MRSSVHPPATLQSEQMRWPMMAAMAGGLHHHPGGARHAAPGAVPAALNWIFGGAATPWRQSGEARKSSVTGRCHACLCRRAMLKISQPTAARFQPARISARRAARERHPPRLLQLQLAGERETSDIIDRQTGTTASAPALRRMIICAPRRPLRCAAISRRCDAHCEPASATTAFRARPPC